MINNNNNYNNNLFIDIQIDLIALNISTKIKNIIKRNNYNYLLLLIFI